MATLTDVVRFLDNLLDPGVPITDPSNNGLQVQGEDTVRKALFAVDASLELFHRAADADADLVFVHHGISWADHMRRITGPLAARLRTLLCNGISLYASHLPLDMHPVLGHNATIARLLQLKDPEPFYHYKGATIGFAGAPPREMSTAHLAGLVEDMLGAQAATYAYGPEAVSRIGVVSGGAADAILQCREAGVDTLITGEMVHSHVNDAREEHINVIAAGHYRTEAPGVIEVMHRLIEHYPDIKCEFVDIPTGL